MIEVKTQYGGPPVVGRREGCKAETWFSIYQGPCFVCPCGADSLTECKAPPNNDARVEERK